jgi:hypothetical protein
MGNLFVTEEPKPLDTTNLKFIKTLTLKKHLESIDDCPLKRDFLKEIPISSNYIMDEHRSITFNRTRYVIYTYQDHHYPSENSIYNHFNTYNLTSLCVLGFNENLLEKYDDIFKSNYSMIHTHQEVMDFQKQVNNMLYVVD